MPLTAAGMARHSDFGGPTTHIGVWSAADRDEVISLIVDIQRNEFGLPITGADQPDLLDVPAWYRAGGGEFWVARSEGSVVGTIAALDIGEGMVALRKMFVAAGERGTGLAARLMSTLMAWATSRGVHTIFLGTTAVMTAGHRFYEKHGFRPVDARALPPSFPRMDVDTRFYRKHISAT